MKSLRRKAWTMVAACFLVIFVTFGISWGAVGVFTIPILSEFGWQRQAVGALWTALGMSMRVSPLAAGWLMDRIEARLVMGTGAAITGIAFLLVSVCHSYYYLMAAYVLLGLGVGGTAFVPASIVIANWFVGPLAALRGRAFGVMLGGMNVGGMILQPVTVYLVTALGWRRCEQLFALPMFFVVIPVIWLVIRSRPPFEGDPSAEHALLPELPGLELREAIGRSSFWLLGLIQVIIGFSVGCGFISVIPYLTRIGYSYMAATFASALVVGLNAVGKLTAGAAADLLGVKKTSISVLMLSALGLWALIGAEQRSLLILYVIIYGLAYSSIVPLLPLLVTDSMGRKRFGTISGVLGLIGAVGGSTAPAIAGRIYDVTKAYTLAFEISIVLVLLGIPAILALRSFASESPVPENYETESSGKRPAQAAAH